MIEGKCLDDSDDEEEQEYRNYALMANNGEQMSTLSQVLHLTTVNMTNAQYKKTVEDLSSEVFNLHTNFIASNDEIVRFSNLNNALAVKGEELELLKNSC